MSLRGQAILIVESEVGSFIGQLQAALERSGAETLVTPDLDTAKDRLRCFTFSAALINVEHRATIDRLDVPFMVYATTEAPKAIVVALERLLD